MEMSGKLVTAAKQEGLCCEPQMLSGDILSLLVGGGSRSSVMAGTHVSSLDLVYASRILRYQDKTCASRRGDDVKENKARSLMISDDLAMCLFPQTCF